MGLQIILLARFERERFADVERIGTFAIDLDADGSGINGCGAKEVQSGEEENGEESGQHEPAALEDGVPVMAQVNILRKWDVARLVRQVLLHVKKWLEKFVADLNDVAGNQDDVISRILELVESEVALE